jgi:hypothetical protein
MNADKEVKDHDVPRSDATIASFNPREFWIAPTTSQNVLDVHETESK